MGVEMPPDEEEELYNILDTKDCSMNGSRKILHTDGFKFLDRAAFISSRDIDDQKRGCRNPWRLCPITQVEEVKCILRLLPIWLCTIIYSVVFTQMASMFVEQGAAMKTTISDFKVPPCKHVRLRYSQRCSFYFSYIGEFLIHSSKQRQLEFFNAQTPDGLKSFGSALCMTSISLGNYVSSLLVTMVMKISTEDHMPGWIPGNLNRGHLDWFYFLLAALTAIDLSVYVACARWYRCIKLEGKCEEIHDQEESFRV
ncbi:hypothetical protein OIU78_014125 [Salix suchowensis]|nr:hypothetical protein OIU78_014125 [Salix suchowensis]